MLLLLRFLRFFKVFFKIQQVVTFYVFAVFRTYSRTFFWGGGGPTRGTGNSNTDDLVLITDRETHAKISLRPVSLSPAPF